MDANTFEQAKELFETINDCYKLITEFDSLDTITSIQFEDGANRLKITVNNELKTEIYNIIRDKIRVSLNEAKEKLEKLIPHKPSIVNAIDTAVKVKAERKWEKTYWFFDIHGTLLKPTYKSGDICTEFYPIAKEVMQVLSKRHDVVMVLYTCSHLDEIDKYLDFFIENGIKFKYVNENPEAENSKYGFFDNKPYMNVLFEDKAGFNPETDWLATKLSLIEHNMWMREKVETKNG
jgi:hypothetical protein